MAYSEITGQLDGSAIRIGIVIARFNLYITRRLLAGTIGQLRRLGVDDSAIKVVWVPGSFELPDAARQLASSGWADAVICIGSVIDGETAHFEYVASATTEGIRRVGADTGIPVIFGVLTTYNTDQAIKRSDPENLNLGSDFAESAIEMANLRRFLSETQN